jgi:hypothetical protein
MALVLMRVIGIGIETADMCRATCATAAPSRATEG